MRSLCMPPALLFCFALHAQVNLDVVIRDAETNRTMPARVYLTDSKGELHVPPGAITYRKYKEQHFITDGRFRINLPAGEYTLTVERGLEYIPKAVQVPSSPSKQHVEVALKRWVSMNEVGWYSGDLHNHRKIDEMPQLLLAEDLNLAPTLTDWIWEDKPISSPPETTEAIRRVDATHAFSVLDKEIERLQKGPGAVDLVGLKTVVPFDGYWLYPPNDRFCKLARDQGAYIDAEKILWRDSPAIAALCPMDFGGIVHNHFNRHGVETDTDEWGFGPKFRPELGTPAGMPLWAMEVYYKFLNCGFRIAASAGSASAVKASPLGYNRVYVKLDEPFSYETWFRALKRGRSFATNGPVLFLTVNDKIPGDTIEARSGPVKLKINADAQTIGQFDRVEIIFKGRVVKSVNVGAGSRRLSAELELPVNETGWVAARAFERPGETVRFAQTSPVYVKIGEDRGIVRDDAKFFIDWIDIQMDHYRREPGFRSPEHREAMLDYFTRAREIYKKLAAQ